MVNATCAALHCNSSSNINKSLKFHQFPHDAERRKYWINACKRTDVLEKDWDYFKHKYVCSLHFSKYMYTKRDRLKKTAVPSLNLSQKSMKHESATQTCEYMENRNPYHTVLENKEEKKGDSRNNVFLICAVQGNKQKQQTKTISTQTDESNTFDSQVYIKEEPKTHTKLKDLIVFEQDAEIKTEIDEHEDTETFEPDEEMKIEIVDNELTYLQSMKTVIPEIETMQDDGTIFSEAPVEEIDLTPTSASTKRSLAGNTDTTSSEPKKLKVDESIQTDRVVIFPIDSEDCEDSLNPGECMCKSNYKLTRSQFYRYCSKFLSPTFSAIVRRQLYLDNLLEKVDK